MMVFARLRFIVDGPLYTLRPPVTNRTEYKEQPGYCVHRF